MYRQMMLKEMIEDTIRRYEKLIGRWEADMPGLPEGSLMKRTDGRLFKVTYSDGNREQKRLLPENPDDAGQIRDIKYKKHIQASLKTLKQQKMGLEALNKGFHIYDPAKVEAILKEQYRGMKGLPVFLEGDINPEDWKQKGGPVMYGEGLIHPSENGLMTRSKSEAMIASKLEQAGLQFEYEPELQLGFGPVLRPDFKILSPVKRKYVYHEHFGLLDNGAYALRTVEKLAEYAKAGIVLGQNLTITYETKDQPLTLNMINGVVEQILSI